MGTRRSILLVDDDADFVAANRQVLEDAGYEVLSAYNGEECIEKARAHRPDLIVLDVMMTRTGEGFDVSRELRNSELTRDIPILMVTSINATVHMHFGPDDTWVPVDEFIEKPLSPRKLLEAVAGRLR